MSDRGSVISAAPSIVDRRSPNRLDAHRFDSIAQAIAAHAFGTPDDVALVIESERVTAAELYARVASALPVIEAFGGPTLRPLAVEMDGSVDSVIAAVAVLASSVPLVPLDHNQPDARRELIMELAGAVVLDHRDMFGALADTDHLRSSPGPSPTDEPDPDDVAMILMTSGSSGTPKGVLLSHRACLGKAYDVIGPLVLRPTDRIGNTLPLGFGAGINTLLAGLLAGVPVICRDPRSTDPIALRQWLRDERPTTLHCSMPLARALADAGDPVVSALPHLRVVVSYGESPEGADLRTVRAGLGPSATFVNWYACTEAGVVAFRLFPPDAAIPDGRLPVGRAARGRRVELVDSAGRPVEPGTIGEIWLRGGDFALGYLGDVPLPIVRTDDGTRCYRTGDRGRVDEHGTLHVVGRIDAAVKVRGYLVEPGEVESAVRRVPGVSDAVVQGVRVGGRTELLAHVAVDPTARRRQSIPGAREIRSAARADLPDWMLPRFIEIYDRLPRTDRGKVDRQSLRRPDEPDVDRRASTSVEPVRSLHTSDLTVLGVAEMVRSVLGRSDVGVDDDLIDLGADSLALTTILARIDAHFHVRVDIARIAADPTITTMATVAGDLIARDARDRRGDSVLVPLRTDGDRTPLVIVAGAGAPAVSLIPSVRHLALGRPVIGVQAWGLENRGFPDRSVRAMARRNVDALRSAVPSGPYLLAGHSMGAHVAWEMAGQLEDRGERVSAVIMIDPHLSDSMLGELRGRPTAPDAEVAEVGENRLHTGPRLDIGLGRLLAVRLKMLVAGPIRFDPVTQWLLFYNLGMATLNRHRPRPLEVPLAVLRTADNPQGRAHWSHLGRGALRIDRVPGGHTDLLREPFVTSVAASIDAAIDELHDD